MTEAPNMTATEINTAISRLKLPDHGFLSDMIDREVTTLPVWLPPSLYESSGRAGHRHDGISEAGADQ